jgi:TolA-binding protein
VLLTGQEISRAGDPARARAVLSDFAAKAANSLLLPEVKLAIVRTYEQQGDWTNAIQQYDLWLANFTNDPARPRAEFCRALDYSHAGNETNAWNSFTNFVATYPTNDLTPQAQWWLADFNFRAGDYNGAENDFQLLFHKWPSSDLACEAWMMAGRAAVARQSWENARDYFTKLYEQTNCPTEVRLKALSAYGDYWISRDSTNKLADYLQAVQIFTQISQESPTNEIGLLALGRKGNALLLSGQFDEAAKAYQQLTNGSAADFTTRAKAIICLADVLEKQADQKTSTNRTELLKQALDRCLDVLFPEKILRDGEKADPFQTKEAGIRAIHLAEIMEDWPHVITISKELCRLMPVLCPSLEKKTAKAQDNLRAKS